MTVLRSSRPHRPAFPHRGMPAFTMVELVISMAISTLLIGALGAALVLASRAVPAQQSPQQTAITSCRALDLMTEELSTAIWVAEAYDHSVAFQVPDRDPAVAPGPEFITYSWSGVAGQPLTRSYNNGIAATIVPDVYDLTFTAELVTPADGNKEAPVADGLLASFSGWSGITPTEGDLKVGESSYAAMCFTITPPADAVSMRITRAEFQMKLGNMGDDSGAVICAVHRSVGGQTPSAGNLGSAAPVPVSSLSANYGWVTFTFGPLTINDPARTDYCLVLNQSAGNGGRLLEYHSIIAPDDGMVERWATSVAGPWQPQDTSMNHQDLPFRIYGVFQTSADPIVPLTYVVRSVAVTVQASPDEATSCHAHAFLLNEPEVSP